MIKKPYIKLWMTDNIKNILINLDIVLTNKKMYNNIITKLQNSNEPQKSNGQYKKDMEHSHKLNSNNKNISIYTLFVNPIYDKLMDNIIIKLNEKNNKFKFKKSDKYENGNDICYNIFLNSTFRPDFTDNNLKVIVVDIVQQVFPIETYNKKWLDILIKRHSDINPKNRTLVHTHYQYGKYYFVWNDTNKLVDCEVTNLSIENLLNYLESKC